MIRLLPSTASQTIEIIPRSYSPLSSLGSYIVNLTITEDGTNKSERLTSLPASVTNNENFVSVTLVSTALATFLKEGSSYYLEFDKTGALWYRDKAYATAQTDNEEIHTLNTNEYDQYGEGSEDEYIVI